MAFFNLVIHQRISVYGRFLLLMNLLFLLGQSLKDEERLLHAKPVHISALLDGVARRPERGVILGDDTPREEVPPGHVADAPVRRVDPVDRDVVGREAGRMASEDVFENLRIAAAGGVVDAERLQGVLVGADEVVLEHRRSGLDVPGQKETSDKRQRHALEVPMLHLVQCEWGSMDMQVVIWCSVESLDRILDDLANVLEVPLPELLVLERRAEDTQASRDPVDITSDAKYKITNRPYRGCFHRSRLLRCMAIGVL